MSTLKRLVSITVVLLVLSLPAYAQEPITLLVWDHFGSVSGGPADMIYEQFMTENPNIVIQREVVDAQQIKDIAPTALASGQGPDLIYMDISDARPLFRGGLLIALDDYAEQYGWYDRFYENGLSWSIVDDQLSGLGMEFEFVGVFINNDIFEQEGWAVPTNLEETLAYCQAASAAGYVPFAHGQNPGWQTFFSFTMPLHNTVGVEWVENRVFNDIGSWDDPGVVRAFEVFYRDMRDANCFDPDVNGLDWQTQQDLFYSGEAPLFPTGTWVVGGIIQNMPDANVTMMPFPATVPDGPRIYTTGMGSAWFIASSAANPDAAAQLIDFMFSDFALDQWVEQAGYVPPLPLDADDYELTELQKFVLETLTASVDPDSGVSLGYNIDVLAPRPFNTMLQEGFQAVMADLKTPEEQAADLERIWEENQE
jgi:raffinose/stachyose/melibiose transport system substrate-binding protein